MPNAIWVSLTFLAVSAVVPLIGLVRCQRKRRFDPTVAPRPLPTLDRSPEIEHIATIYPSLSGSLEHIHLALGLQGQGVPVRMNYRGKIGDRRECGRCFIGTPTTVGQRKSARTKDTRHAQTNRQTL